MIFVTVGKLVINEYAVLNDTGLYNQLYRGPNGAFKTDIYQDSRELRWSFLISR